MEKIPKNCSLNGTPHCPEIKNPVMQKFFVKDIEIEPNAEITLKDIEESNRICKDCTSFTPIKS